VVGGPPTSVPSRAGGSSRILAAMTSTVVVGAALGLAVGYATRPVSRVPTLLPALPSPATARASALYDRALSTIASSIGFHYVAVFPGTETIVGDAARSAGRQVVTFKSSYGLEAFTLLLDSNGTVYFQGNAAAVEDQLGVSAINSSKIENRWVALSRADGPYSDLEVGITVADQSIFVPMIPTSTASVRVDGMTATQISGTVTAADDPASTARLTIASGSDTPLAYASTAATSGGGTTSTVTFSAWGTAVPVGTPSRAIAWSTIGASMPPGGYGSG